MINRNVTRTILNTTETTAKTKSLESDVLPFALASSDYFYIGFRQPFATRYFYLSTPNTNPCTISIEFWNGNQWLTVEDIIDETEGFTKSGFVSWVNPPGWIQYYQAPVIAKDPRNTADTELRYYWLRMKVSASLSAGTELQAVVNLFCTDNLFRAYYPDIFNDSRYLPPGRTDLMEQYQAARDLVVMRLKQAGKIAGEGDILEINEVAIAAAHATAYVILQPMKGGDDVQQAKKDAFQAMERELTRAMITVDSNEDGRTEPEERPTGTNWVTR
jgi:hypothetical protein